MSRKIKVDRLAATNIKVESSYSKEIGNCRIDKDLLTLLKPLNLMQALCLFDKYKIMKGMITPNSLRYNILSMLGSTIVLIIAIFTQHKKNSFGSTAFHSVVIFGYVVNYYTHMARQNDNIILVIKIQELVSFLNKDGSYIRYLTIYNWTWVILINFLNVLLAYFYLKVIVNISIFDFIRNYMVVHFDINVIYNAVFIKILCEFVRLWLEKVQKPGSSEERNDEYWKKMFHIYVKILKAYHLTERSFQLLVSFKSILSYRT